MKCSQKSCNRKSINVSSGFCNVCEEVVKDTTNKVKNIAKEGMMGKKVEIDFKKMLEVHEKLSKGEMIDSTTVNGILLGGIMNILVQHDAIEELDKRVKSVEAENRTLNARVESLESWNAKQSEEIKTVAEHIQTFDTNGVIVKETAEIKVLKKKFVELETEINRLKLHKSRRTQNETSSEPDKVPSKGFEQKYNICDQTFKANSDFEKHMVESH